MKRIVILVLAVLFVVGSVLAWRWACEPLERKRYSWEEPARVNDGLEVRGEFTPQRHGMIHLACRLRNTERVREFSEAVQGDWRWHEGPPGIRISFDLLDDGKVIATRNSEDRLSGGWSATDAYISIGTVDNVHPVPHEIVVRVESADPRLAAFDTSFAVGPVGDWISYRTLEAQIRRVLVVLGVGAGLLAAGVWMLVARVRRVRAASGAPRDGPETEA